MIPYIKTKPTAEIVTASKELIDGLRALDTHNRNKKQSRIDDLRREIRAGNFMLTNQGVGVTVSNFICDGGHRLEAIALEGYPPVQFVLVRGLPDDAQKYVDQHAKRSMADTLTLFFDQTISNQIIGGLNVVLRAKNRWRSGVFSPDALIHEFKEKESEIIQLAALPKSRMLPAPVFAALLDVLYETQDERVLDFAEQVIRGEMLKTGDPALALRNWLNSGQRPDQHERYLKARAALSAHLEGRRITKLYARELENL